MTSNGFFFQNIPTTLVTTAVESLVTTATMTRTASLQALDQERRQTRVSGPTTRTVTTMIARAVGGTTVTVNRKKRTISSPSGRLG